MIQTGVKTAPPATTMGDASAEGSGTFSGKFMFVGNVANDAKSGKQIRSHLMREYYRKERWKKCMNHRQERGGPEQDAQDPDSPPPKKKATAAQVSKGVNKRPRIETIPRPQTATVVAYTAKSPSPSPSLLPEPLFCPPLPKKSDDLSSASETAFSAYTPREGGQADEDEYHEPSTEHSLARLAARRSMRTLVEDFYIKRPSLCGSPGSEIFVGPFGYLPIKLNPTDHAVLQYYPRIPELVYGVEPSNRFAVHKTVFLPIAFLYPESLYMCLASANLYMTQRYGIADTSLTDFYKAKAYARIQEAMNKAESRYADSVVAGLCGSAALALGVSPGFSDESNMYEFMTHMMGLGQVMRMRGGQQSTRDNPRLDLGYTSIWLIIGKTWTEALGKIVPDGFEQYAKADIFDFIYDAKQLSGWLRQAVRWARSVAQFDAAQYATTLKQAETFNVDKPLYRVLKQPRALVEGSERRILFESAHHSFALLYIALAMFEFRDQPSDKDAFLDALRDGLKHNDISKAYTCTSLAWMLYQIFVEQPERNWLTLAFAKVAWRISDENFTKLKDFLLWMIYPIEGPVPFLTDEEIQEIERDALHDLVPP
ncbi:hypothetical protein UCRPC4_g03300 [Phaeomoniella chlamydospora]|uniref:Uncharacterized protein n=1 Tax=Phaeomoniella chlamydospora TaxID=158046 RepID=A0A0G2EHF5_PHACM|nr:hypothetical protein UCRPC4_g03300 [Phaeomoniella chlamydospora]